MENKWNPVAQSPTGLSDLQSTEDKAMAKKQNARLQANLSLLSDTQSNFASEQVQLLMAIEQCGSISGAARQVGISYKTAWDRIEAINNLSEHPVVIRSAGGAKGGGTSITEYGRQIITGFKALQEEHESYLERLSAKVNSLNDIATFMRIGTLKTSARNQFRGTVVEITPGAVNAEIRIKISETQSLSAIITEESRQQLGLEIGCSAIALIKASWIMLSNDTEISTSARNRLIGQVSRITTGAVNSDVVIDLGDGKSINAIVTNSSITEMGLKQGEPACAFFQASSIILMVEG